MEETKIINKIEDVEVGDIAYFEGVEMGPVVVSVDPHDDNSSLKVETPEEFKPFNLYSVDSVWLQNSCFRYAIRLIHNKIENAPEVTEGEPAVFFTQSGRIVIFDGYEWKVQDTFDEVRDPLDPHDLPLIPAVPADRYHSEDCGVEKSLPEVREGYTRAFETQSGIWIAYDGSKSRSWSIEPSLSDKRLLELLDPSQFPLKDITEEES